MPQWRGFHIVLELKSPLHVGRRVLGNLQTTRPYVPGRALWGALTMRMQRGVRPPSGSYERTGMLVQEQLAFTYLYPSDSAERVRLWPWGGDRPEFDYQYLDSYTSTALENGRTAEEGSLHDTEFLAPVTREGRPVYLHGAVFERISGTALTWVDAANAIALGSDRSTGWGRLRPHGQPRPLTEQVAALGLCVDLDHSRPRVQRRKGAVLLAHAKLGSHDASMDGVLEPLAGRETNLRTAETSQMSAAVRAWAPGTAITAESMWFSVEGYGVWDAV